MVNFFTAEELVENYEKFRKLINQTFTGERLDALNKMYDHFEERMIYTPASSVEHFHNAFPGGYVDHVLRVTRNALKVYDLYTELGMGMNDYTRENLIFTALHHDLGKLGTPLEDLYIKNDSEWHVKNQGKIYKYNPNIHWMSLNDRTFYNLNYFGIRCTEEEWIGIKLTDGLYDENNKEYFIKFDKDQAIKTSIPFIMHTADLFAARFENERWIKEMQPQKSTRNTTNGRPKKSDLGNAFTNGGFGTVNVFDAFKDIIED
jgi:hypothetical protein